MTSPDTASACSRAAACHPSITCFPTGLHQAQVRANDQLLVRRREPPRGEGGYQRPAVRCGSLVHLGPSLQRAGESLHHDVRGARGYPASWRNLDHLQASSPSTSIFPPSHPPQQHSHLLHHRDMSRWHRDQTVFPASHAPGHPSPWAHGVQGWAGVLSRVREGSAQG